MSASPYPHPPGAGAAANNDEEITLHINYLNTLRHSLRHSLPPPTSPLSPSSPLSPPPAATTNLNLHLLLTLLKTATLLPLTPAQLWDTALLLWPPVPVWPGVGFGGVDGGIPEMPGDWEEVHREAAEEAARVLVGWEREVEIARDRGRVGSFVVLGEEEEGGEGQEGEKEKEGKTTEAGERGEGKKPAEEKKKRKREEAEEKRKLKTEAKGKSQEKNKGTINKGTITKKKDKAPQGTPKSKTTTTANPTDKKPPPTLGTLFLSRPNLKHLSPRSLLPLAAAPAPATPLLPSPNPTTTPTTTSTIILLLTTELSLTTLLNTTTLTQRLALLHLLGENKHLTTLESRKLTAEIEGGVIKLPQGARRDLIVRKRVLAELRGRYPLAGAVGVEVDEAKYRATMEKLLSKARRWERLAEEGGGRGWLVVGSEKVVRVDGGRFEEEVGVLRGGQGGEMGGYVDAVRRWVGAWTEVVDAVFPVGGGEGEGDVERIVLDAEGRLKGLVREVRDLWIGLRGWKAKVRRRKGAAEVQAEEEADEEEFGSAEEEEEE